jgi:DNA-binding XRE family transcriptional regulator
MRAVAAGTLQTLSGGDVDAYLAAATPLAFWRKHRGFTQADMAREVGVSQPYPAQLENGQRRRFRVRLSAARPTLGTQGG